MVAMDSYRQKINSEWMWFHQVTVTDKNGKDSVFLFDSKLKAEQFCKGVKGD